MLDKLIVTVCKGNIHRSVIAAYCINKHLALRGISDRIVCESRGLNGTAGTPMSTGKNLHDYPRAIKLIEPYLDKYNILIPSSQISTPILINDVQRASIVLAMDSEVLMESHNSLVKQFPAFTEKMIMFSSLVGLHFNIQDVGDVLEGKVHERVIKEIVDITQEGMDKLIEIVLQE